VLRGSQSPVAPINKKAAAELPQSIDLPRDF
jgi:hypothetical protein